MPHRDRSAAEGSTSWAQRGLQASILASRVRHPGSRFMPDPSISRMFHRRHGANRLAGSQSTRLPVARLPSPEMLEEQRLRALAFDICEGFLSLEQGMAWSSTRDGLQAERLSTFVNERLVQKKKEAQQLLDIAARESRRLLRQPAPPEAPVASGGDRLESLRHEVREERSRLRRARKKKSRLSRLREETERIESALAEVGVYGRSEEATASTVRRISDDLVRLHTLVDITAEQQSRDPLLLLYPTDTGHNPAVEDLRTSASRSGPPGSEEEWLAGSWSSWWRRGMASRLRPPTVAGWPLGPSFTDASRHGVSRQSSSASSLQTTTAGQRDSPWELVDNATEDSQDADEPPSREQQSRKESAADSAKESAGSGGGGVGQVLLSGDTKPPPQLRQRSSQGSHTSGSQLASSRGSHTASRRSSRRGSNLRRELVEGTLLSAGGADGSGGGGGMQSSSQSRSAGGSAMATASWTEGHGDSEPQSYTAGLQDGSFSETFALAAKVDPVAITLGWGQMSALLQLVAARTGVEDPFSGGCAITCRRGVAWIRWKAGDDAGETRMTFANGEMQHANHRDRLLHAVGVIARGIQSLVRVSNAHGCAVSMPYVEETTGGLEGRLLQVGQLWVDVGWATDWRGWARWNAVAAALVGYIEQLAEHWRSARPALNALQWERLWNSERDAFVQSFG